MCVGSRKGEDWRGGEVRNRTGWEEKDYRELQRKGNGKEGAGRDMKGKDGRDVKEYRDEKEERDGKEGKGRGK